MDYRLGQGVASIFYGSCSLFGLEMSTLSKASCSGEVEISGWAFYF